jgi:hypothetical protein
MMTLARRRGTFLPTADQHHLLRAALLTERKAVIESLHEWRRLMDLDDIDHGSSRVLPLLYRNLERLSIDDAAMGRFKGIYRRAWYRNELLISSGLDAVRSLRAAGVESMLLKGASLVATVCPEHALRPMQDFDILVERHSFARAVDLLLTQGWRIDPPLRDPEAHLAFQHGVSLRRGGGELDVHWLSAWGMFDLGGEAEFWRAARRVLLGGETVEALDSADQLLQICVHATLASPLIPPIRWVADAVLILRDAPLDWQRLVRMSRLRGFSLAVYRCLTYLREGLDIDVPIAVLEELHRDARAIEYPLLSLRCSFGAGYHVHSFLMWMKTAFLDGWGALPARLRLFARFLRSRVDAKPDDSWLTVMSRAFRLAIASR